MHAYVRVRTCTGVHGHECARSIVVVIIEVNHNVYILKLTVLKHTRTQVRSKYYFDLLFIV